MEISPGLIPVFNQVSHTQLTYLSHCPILAQNKFNVCDIFYKVDIEKGGSRIQSCITRSATRCEFSYITSYLNLLDQFITSAATLVYYVVPWVQQKHWLTRQVHGFSSITGLLCQFIASGATLVNYVVPWV